MAQRLGAAHLGHSMRGSMHVWPDAKSGSSRPKSSLFFNLDRRACASSFREWTRVGFQSRSQPGDDPRWRKLHTQGRLVQLETFSSSFSSASSESASVSPSSPSSARSSSSWSASSLVNDEAAEGGESDGSAVDESLGDKEELSRGELMKLVKEKLGESGGPGVEESPRDKEEQSRGELMKLVMEKLSEEDLEEAAKKYSYEEELFSRIDFAQINAFTNRAFSGNPAAVCYLPYQKHESWLQLIAQEFNLPATAFVIKRRGKKTSSMSNAGKVAETNDADLDTSGGLEAVRSNVRRIDNEFDIRWFTATAELELCGHATLASAHMIFSSGLVEGDTIIFHSKKGKLKARKISGYGESDEAPQEEADPKARIQSKLELGKGVIELDFPISCASEVDASEARVVLDALGGVEAVWVGKTPIGDFLVELPSSKDVENLRPVFEKMLNFGGRGGVIATARASDSTKYDIYSRFFVPKAGILEDPVTGSAHCALGPYWAVKLKKDSLQAFQASPRGGEVSLRVDTHAGRVYLQGGAVLLMAGTLLNTFRA